MTLDKLDMKGMPEDECVPGSANAEGRTTGDHPRGEEFSK
jgi:hypothetical protein